MEILTDRPAGKAACQVTVRRQAVKRHHHKHNLKHRYEFMETLGKGTYGKVKKAEERSGRLVSTDVIDLLSIGFVIRPATCWLAIESYFYSARR